MTDTAKLFKEVKLITRSLLLSAPKGLTIRNFVNDYRVHNGQEFPFRDLGYNSAIDLIRDLSDAVRIEWMPFYGDYMLKGIADDSTRHIENLVKKQRKSRSGYPQPPRFQRFYNHDTFRNYNNENTSYVRKTVNQSALKRATHHHLSGLVPAKLRSQIRQLLASYEDGLLISNFRVAFKKHFGTDFPLINLGFSSLENCLRHIPDIVILRHSDSLLKAYPAKKKDDEETTRSKSTSAILPETPVGETEQPKKHKVNGTFDYKNISQQHMDALDGFDSPEELKTKHNTCQDNVVSRMQDDGALDDTFIVKTEHNKLNDNFIPKVQYNNVEDTLTPNIQHNAVDDTFSKIHSTSENIFISRTQHNTHESFSPRCELERQNDINTSVTAQNISDDSIISEKMKQNFQRVLQFHPEGIWATEFLQEYNVFTRQNLDVTELGYFSLIELVSALPNIFIIRRPDNCKDDWLLFGVNNPNMKKTESICTKGAASTSLNSSTYEEDIEINETLKHNVLSILKECHKDIALEEFEKIYKANFNVDLPWESLGFDNIEAFMVVLSGDIPLNLRNINGKFYVTLQSEIPKCPKPSNMFVELKSEPPNIPNDSALSDCSFQNQALPEDLSKYIGIFVSSVDNPGQIWIQIRGETTTVALEVLMENLEKVYYGSESDDYKMPESCFEVGHVCAVVWPGDDNWHRAIITGIPGKEFVEVLYVDYGSKGTVKKSGLRLLKREFLGLPAQALKARLAHVLPAVGKRWSEKSKQVLLSLCTDKPLAALIINTEYEERLSICLCDVSADKDLHINDFLVREGYAKPSKDPYAVDINEENLSPPVNQMQGTDINKIALALANYQSLTGMANMAAARLITQLSSSGINIDTLPQILSSCTLSPNSDRFAYREDSIPPPTSASNIHDERNFIDEPREIFEEGDEFYEQLCQSAEELKISIKRISLTEDHIIHIIDSNNKPFVSSGDISSLFGKSICLEKLLMMKKILIPSVVLEKSNNEEIFQELKRYNVKGIKNEKEGTARITLYPLQSVMEILDGLSLPSEILRKKMANIIIEINNHDDFWQDNDIVEDYLTSQSINSERMSTQELLIEYEKQCNRRSEIIQEMMDPTGTKDYHVEELSCIESNLLKLDARMKEIEEARKNEIKNGHRTLHEIQDFPKREVLQQPLIQHNSQNSLACDISSKELRKNRISPQSINNISFLDQEEICKDIQLFKDENTITQLHSPKTSLQYNFMDTKCNNKMSEVSSQVCNDSAEDIFKDNSGAIPKQILPSCYSEQASRNIPLITQGKISPAVPSKPSVRFSSQMFAPRICSPSSLPFPVRPSIVQPRYTWNSGKSTS